MEVPDELMVILIVPVVPVVPVVVVILRVFEGYLLLQDKGIMVQMVMVLKVEVEVVQVDQVLECLVDQD